MLHDLGQSLWLDNITRELLDNGTLRALHRRVFGHRADLEPDDLRPRDRQQRRLRRAAFASKARRPRRARSCSSSWRWRTCAAPPTCSARPTTRPDGVDGWVSLEVSPLLAHDTAGSIAAASALHRAAGRAQPLHQDSRARRQAFRRSRSRSSPACRSTSRCCSRASSTSPRPTPTCAASSGASPPASTRASPRSPRCSSAAGTWRSPTRCRPSCATGSASRSASAPTRPIASCSHSPRWQRSPRPGARPQRLLWASTGTKDPKAPDTLYVEALAAPDTINTMPEKTLRAFADHGKVARRDGRATAAMPTATLAQFAAGGHRRRRARRAAAGRRRRRRSSKSWTRAAAAHRRQAQSARRAGVEPRDERRLHSRRCVGPRDGAAGVAGAAGARAADQAPTTCASCSPTIPSAASGSPPKPPDSTSTIRSTASPTRRCACCSQLAGACGVARRASTRCSAASRSTSPRTARCCTSRCARPRCG